MKKLFIVTFTAEVAVLAEDAEHAALLAEEHKYDIQRESEADAPVPMRHLPDGWDRECCAYGDPRTLDELIAAGHAPEYTALRERARDRRERVCDRERRDHT
jgi:hypothetical protein